MTPAPDSAYFVIFLVFTGAALAATLALYARQAMIVAYIALGALLGPSGADWVPRSETISGLAEVGIVFLLFLLGLNLHPQKLFQMLREALDVTLISAAAFALLGGAVALGFGFGWHDIAVIAAASMFSSTIIGLKLLPATALHHRHTGEIIISVLLIQDLIAIVALLLLRGLGPGETVPEIGRSLLALPALMLAAWLAERYILVPLLQRFDGIQEYVFLLAIGWCLGAAQFAHILGLPREIGAFTAGVALASSPISRFIAESLRPLRDFFLVLFFFALGAEFDWPALRPVIVPAAALALLLLLAKPLAFHWLLRREGEADGVSWETGVRLGQISEFSLLLAASAAGSGFATSRGVLLLQAATIITFAVSTYLIVLRYPTPIAASRRLRRD